MTLTHSITLHIRPLTDWEGNLITLPGIFPEKATPDTPGSDVGDIRFLPPLKKGSPNRLLLSLGTEDKLNPEVLRKASGVLIKWLEKNGVTDAGVALEDLRKLPLPIEESLNAFSEGILLGGFQYIRHKSTPPERTPISFSFLLKGGEKEPDATRLAEIIQQAIHVTAAVNLSRSWAHEPPNIINPITLAERVGRIASKENLKFTVIDDKQLKEIGANAILSVGKGSQTPSRMIILEYPGQDSMTLPVVLVGKAITFDTGGYSLKERTGMVGMKYDKSGGMTVIATLIAAARLELKTPVIGIIAAAENMVSGGAYRPNDILVTLSGKTVEVISADAEGRLVLCDALTYAQKQYHPSAIIDLATLTGGVVIALGKLRAGIMGNHQPLAEQLIQSGIRTHERLWQLPLDDEYLDLIKGDDSDLKNSGAREAHAIIGGIFLKQFVSADIPWAHLDIAGVANIESDMAYCPKGATGFGVRLLIDFLRSYKM